MARAMGTNAYGKEPRRGERTLSRGFTHRRARRAFLRPYGAGASLGRSHRAYALGYFLVPLIIANPDGTPLKPDSVSETVSRLCRMLGLPKGASLHTVRHSHASLLLEKASTSRPSANASAIRRWPRPPPSTAGTHGCV